MWDFIDFQITGDLIWAQEHVSGFQVVCEHNIQQTVNVSDPENPASDPVYQDIMGSFLNTTCLNDCSGLGYCNLGACQCNPGNVFTYMRLGHQK